MARRAAAAWKTGTAPWHHAPRIPAVPRDLAEPVMYLSWTGGVPIRGYDDGTAAVRE
jgi:hypothetical protein